MRFALSFQAGAGCVQRQLIQLLLVVGIQNRLEGWDCVEQISVSLETSLSHYCGIFSLDQPSVYQRTDVFPHRVLTEVYRFANCFVAGPALMSFPIFTAEQVCVDRQFARTETEEENFVGEWECVLVGIMF